jgi:hypothetical protein
MRPALALVFGLARVKYSLAEARGASRSPCPSSPTSALPGPPQRRHCACTCRPVGFSRPAAAGLFRSASVDQRSTFTSGCTPRRNRRCCVWLDAAGGSLRRGIPRVGASAAENREWRVCWSPRSRRRMLSRVPRHLPRRPFFRGGAIADPAVARAAGVLRTSWRVRAKDWRGKSSGRRGLVTT